MPSPVLTRSTLVIVTTLFAGAFFVLDDFIASSAPTIAAVASGPAAALATALLGGWFV